MIWPPLLPGHEQTLWSRSFCLPQGRILTTCAFSMLINDRKWKHIYMLYITGHRCNILFMGIFAWIPNKCVCTLSMIYGWNKCTTGTKRLSHWSLDWHWGQWRLIPVKLPWIFPGAPLNFNGAPGNIQGNLDRYEGCQSNILQTLTQCHYFCYPVNKP